MTFVSDTKEQGLPGFPDTEGTAAPGAGARTPDGAAAPADGALLQGRAAGKQASHPAPEARRAPRPLADRPERGPRVQRKRVIFNKRAFKSVKVTLIFPYLVY